MQVFSCPKGLPGRRKGNAKGLLVPKSSPWRAERYRKRSSRAQVVSREGGKVPQERLSCPNRLPGGRKGTARASFVPKSSPGRAQRYRKSVFRAQIVSREGGKVPQERLSCPNRLPGRRKGTARASFAPKSSPGKVERYRKSVFRAQIVSREDGKVPQERLSCPNRLPGGRKGTARASFLPKSSPGRAQRYRKSGAQIVSREGGKVPQEVFLCPKGLPGRPKGNEREPPIEPKVVIGLKNGNERGQI